MDKNDLLRLVADDDMGLLQVRQKVSGAVTADERLVASFEEISRFVKENGREPSAGNGVQEHRLYARLKGFRESKEKIEVLKPLDALRLLPDQVKEIKTINDIFDDDDLGILNDDAESIFTLKHIPKETTMPDYVAQRKPCKDFAEFEDRFKQCQSDLTSGKRQLRPFANEQQIDKGYFFVLKGVLLYVAEVGEREMLDGKRNARLRCIFENGTESDMLLRSLSAELYKDGRRVTENGDRLLAGFDNITAEDQESGFIYVLRSLSEKPEIQSVHNLYKIGFSRVPVEERIKNAAEEPTYLMAPVKIVTAYQCYNMNPQKLELLLHTFFGSSCLNIDVFDGAGQRHTPREWFLAPLDVIEQAIHFLLNGEIVDYRYDPERQEIVGRN
ncbi:MAG: GIY-YIG nuclease family protein [Alphaproteobacteria bacterium]|nr:GIY-YIG nuclease family protein [Alphaproteobacteria bacterium]